MLSSWEFIIIRSNRGFRIYWSVSACKHDRVNFPEMVQPVSRVAVAWVGQARYPHREWKKRAKTILSRHTRKGFFLVFLSNEKSWKSPCSNLKLLLMGLVMVCCVVCCCAHVSVGRLFSYCQQVALMPSSTEAPSPSHDVFWPSQFQTRTRGSGSWCERWVKLTTLWIMLCYAQSSVMDFLGKDICLC